MMTLFCLFNILFHLCGAYHYEHQINVKREVLRCGMEETLVTHCCLIIIFCIVNPAKSFQYG